MLRSFALLLHLGERYGLLNLRLPTGQRVGEEDAGALGPACLRRDFGRKVVRRRRVERLHGEPDLQMGDDEGRRHDLEAEHALRRRLPDPRAGKRAEAAPFKIGGDAGRSHLRQVGPRAAARIEHVDVLGRQPVRDAEVILQRPVHAGDPCSGRLR